MSEFSNKRLISIEVPGIGPPELDAALAGLRAAVEDLGGRMSDRVVSVELDLATDEGLRQASHYVKYLENAGLLDPEKQIADLIIVQRGNAERFGDSQSLKGVNKRILHNLAGSRDGHESVTATPGLLAMSTFELRRKGVGDKQLLLLRRALVDSGMPEEYPWPQDGLLENTGIFLRSVLLISPTLEGLPGGTKDVLAKCLLGDPLAPPLTLRQLEKAAGLYKIRRQEIMRIVEA